MTHSRAEEARMMRSPMEWPMMKLPVKRDGDTGMEVGTVLAFDPDGTADGDLLGTIRIYKASVLELDDRASVLANSRVDSEPVTNTEVLKDIAYHDYPTADAAVEDGWMVD